MEQDRIVGLDVGGSGTRADYFTGNRKMELPEMASRLKRIDKFARIINDLTDPLDDFEIVSNNILGIRGRYIRGEGTTAHKNGTIITADNLSLKCQQDITYINALHALAKIAFKANSKADSVITLKVGIVLPVIEYTSEDNLTDLVKEKLSAGIHEVYFPVYDKLVKFQIKKKNIFVGGEGAIYLMSLKKKRPDIVDLLLLNEGIVIDIGRRSVDITLFRNFRPVLKASKSAAMGGIAIEASVLQEIERTGDSIDKDNLTDVIAKEEAEGIDLSVHIDKAKQNLGSAIIEEIKMALVLGETNFQRQKYIVLLGNSFNGEEECGTLRDSILQYFKPDIQVFMAEDNSRFNSRAMLDMLCD